jgi:hypothetical protein
MLPLPGLHVTENGEGIPVIAIRAKGHSITDPTVDESMMVTVPPDYYGLSQAQVDFFKKLNVALDDATEAALNAGCFAIQTAIGQDDGGIAGVHFSGDTATAPIRTALGEYLITEVNIATKE